MELRHIRYFVAVAEDLSFTSAARRLNTAQPSLSQQIRDLENVVGAKLLHRTKRKVELTPAGRVFLAEAQLLLVQADRAIKQAQQADQVEVIELNIGCGPAAELRVFPRLLPALRTRAPELRIKLCDLGSTAMKAALRKGEVDVAFARWHDHTEPPFQSHLLFREEFIVVLPDGHPLIEEELITLKALAPYPFVEYAGPWAPEGRELFDVALEHQRITLKTVMFADNVLMNLNLISMGLGYGILPSYVRELLVNNMQWRPIKDAPHIDLSVVWKAAPPSPALDVFLQLIREQYPYGVQQS